MANEKISEYVADATSNPLHPLDLMDISSFVNPSFPATYDVSKKITLVELTTFLGTIFGNTIYTGDGSLLENRTVTSNGFWTKFEGGDVIVEMDNESDDYAFIVNSVGIVEQARLGYDQITQSAILQLQNLLGVWFEANDEVITTDATFKATNGGGQIGLRAFGVNGTVSITSDNDAYAESYVYLDPTKTQLGYGGDCQTLYNATNIQHIWLGALGSSQSFGTRDAILGVGTIATNDRAIKIFDAGVIFSSASQGGKGLSLNADACNFNAFVDSSTVNAGFSGIAKTNRTAYFNQLGFNNGGGLFETIILDAIATADRLQTLQDKSGIIALTSDIPQGLSETLAISDVMQDTDRLRSTDGKTEVQVNTLGAGLQHGTIGVDTVSYMEVSDEQTQLFLFNSGFTKTGNLGLFSNDVLRNFNAFATPSYPAKISCQGGIFNAGVVNSVQIGGNSSILKTDETAYCNQLAFNTGEAFETVLDYTTPTADRTITLPNADINFETAITETLTFGGGASGDVATMTFANGILTSRTLVP